jgi:hypothetical protein
MTWARWTRSSYLIESTCSARWVVDCRWWWSGQLAADANHIPDERQRSAPRCGTDPRAYRCPGHEAGRQVCVTLPVACIEVVCNARTRPTSAALLEMSDWSLLWSGAHPELDRVATRDWAPCGRERSNHGVLGRLIQHSHNLGRSAQLTDCVLGERLRRADEDEHREAADERCRRSGSGRVA